MTLQSLPEPPDATNARLFTNQHPLGPTFVQDDADLNVLAALYDSRVRLHLASTQNPPTFIVGRRGSGKTALLLSREFDPKNLALRLSASEVFSRVQVVIDLLDDRAVLTVESVAQLWDMLLWGPIAVRLAKAERSRRDPDVAFQTLWNGTSILRRAAEDAAQPDDEVIEHLVGLVLTFLEQGQSVTGIEALGRRLQISGVPWRDVIEAGKQVVAARDVPVFVLIDSLENMGELIQKLSPTLQGLFHLVGQINMSSSKNSYRIQCCFPSELWPALNTVSANPVKDFEGRMVLQWRWQDLLRACATRLRAFLEREHPGLLEGLKPEDFRQLLDRLLPALIVNHNGREEPTIAYILRHTQLLPRQVIYILNEAIHRAIIDTGEPIVSSQQVVDAVTEAEATLAPEVFSAHQYRYPQAQDIALRLVPYLPFRFDDAYFHKAFNRAGVAKEFNQDWRSVRTMFADIGIIGRFVSETGAYTKAEFAYAVEGRMNLSPDETYCLHPLFVRQYGSSELANGPAPDGALRERKPVYPMGTPEIL